MAAFEDKYFWSNDGLRLHYRDYAGPDDRPTLLCLPGLTRNARDFDAFTDRYAGQWRLWCLELRGRGDSAYAKDPLTYVPLIYLQDIKALIDDAKPSRLLPVGTSLGGILAMLMAATMRPLLAGAILNDIGPDIHPEGAERIRSYLGKSGPWPTWMHAAWALRELNQAIYPDYNLEDWLKMAKRLCYLQPNGRIAVDYDPNIAVPFKLPRGEAGVDLWPAFDALAGLPVLALRGQTSDLLSKKTFQAMKRRMPTMEAVTVPGVGHAPTLEEPEAAAAVDGFLEKVIN